MTPVARKLKVLRPVLVLLLTCVTLPAWPVESLEGRIALISGEDWSISGLRFSVQLDGSSLRGNVRIDSLDLPSAGMSFADVDVECGRIALSTAEFGCLAARFSLELPAIGREAFPGEAIYERETGATRFHLRGVTVADGSVDLRGTASETSVDIDYAGEGLQLAALAGIAKGFRDIPLNLSASGLASVRGRLRLRNSAVSHASMTAELTGASVSNEAGTLVTDAMHAITNITADKAGSRWHFVLDIAADAGEAYVEPVYVNLGESKVTVNAQGGATNAFDDVQLTTFSMTQGTLIDATGELRARMGSDAEAASLSGTVRLADSSVDAIYSGLLQVLLAGSPVGDLQTAGTVAGRLKLEDNVLSAVDLELSELSLDDNQDRFAVHGLNGAIRWPGAQGEAADSELSQLSWQSASAYDIPFGAGEIAARLGGDDFHLAGPLRLPTMGGALRINRLLLNNLGKADASGLLDAELEPIELSQLTSAFGWPAFSGSLSGRLPLLQYDGEVVTVGGTLAARAFDGDIEFANLRLEEPLGLVPRLYGDLRLRQLDLEQLTDTFAFGLIQGRLSGDVTGLEMIAWRPVIMDLHLYTPPGDKSRHRISQRAVENLASVGGGGGAAAALSSGFMKFFEEFSYDRIGIRCVLQDGTCSMSGAGPARESEFGQGYYIVKGSGLPRIDVVGYRHQVSWNALVGQLINITESGAPVVD